MVRALSSQNAALLGRTSAVLALYVWMRKAMKPIIFNAESVRAILGGRKTQTRRVINRQPQKTGLGDWSYFKPNQIYAEYTFMSQAGMTRRLPKFCPYGYKGESLWVRETWNCSFADQEVREQDADPKTGECLVAFYKADDEDDREGYFGDWYYPEWRSPIFMPRWASRITLQITDVRVQQVQDITTADLRAEGMRNTVDYGPILYDQFARVWDSINAKRGYGWAKDPWVWVIEFTKDA